MAARLRERMRAVEGDGFGHAGHLIGAYKRTLQKLSEAIELAETVPPPSESDRDQSQPNPDCMGRGGDNVSSCECRVIFSIIGRP